MIRNEIWEDMKAAKTQQNSCLYYVDKKRKFNRGYNFAIILIAGLGAFTFFLNHWCAFATTLAASIMEMVKSFVPAVCQSEKELVELDDLATFYGKTLSKLEEMWSNNESGHADNDKLQKELSKIKRKVAENVTKTNKLIHSLSEKEDKKIQDSVIEYLTRKYYGN